jgi:hypothetical protein
MGGYLGHRLAWLYMVGVWPDDEIDHWNRDPSDNRFTNLRDATHAKNGFNSGKRSNNSSGRKGVSLDTA